MNCRAVASIFVLLSAALSFSATAADTRFSAVGRVGFDWIPAAKQGSTDTPTVEVSTRLSISPSTALELGIGYRHFSYDRFGGRSSEEYSITQVPIAFGVHYIPFPRAKVQPTLGAGVHFSITHDSWRT